MAVVLFKFAQQDVVVNSQDVQNVCKYFMQTTEIIKRDTITACLRENILRQCGIFEEA